jgi:hypothetical protein
MIIKARHWKLLSKIVDIIFQFLELVLDVWVRAKDIFKVLNLAACKSKNQISDQKNQTEPYTFCAGASELAYISNYAVQYQHIRQQCQYSPPSCKLVTDFQLIL